jgi:hypothetical protein
MARQAVAAEIQTTAAAFIVVLMKHGYLEEALEFTEWLLETFDWDLPELHDVLPADVSDRLSDELGD